MAESIASEQKNMKTLSQAPRAALLAIVIGLSPAVEWATQATVVVSNLGQTDPSPAVVDITDLLWSGQSFTTDVQARDLIQVTLRMAAATTTGGNFSVRIFSNGGGDQPGSVISNGILTGDATPDTAGDYVYTPSATLTLAAGTKYWVVALVTSGTAQYEWKFRDTFDVDAGVGTLNNFADSPDGGGSWTLGSSTEPNFLSVEATPEPSAFGAVAALGLLGFAAWRRTRSGQ